MYLIGGYDAMRSTARPNWDLDSVTLLRKYNENGIMQADYRNHQVWEVNKILKYPNQEKYMIVAPQVVVKLTGENVTKGTPINFYNKLSAYGDITPYPFADDISFTENDGYFVRIQYNSETDAKLSYEGGSGLYKMNSSDNRVYDQRHIPETYRYSAPLLLQGTTNTYIGTRWTKTSSGSSVTTTATNMYELTDNGSTFLIKAEGTYPNGTTLRTAGLMDGFFASGSSSGQATIAKLSTCANFKLYADSVRRAIANPFSRQSAIQSITVTPVGNSGATADITWSWTATDITDDGPAGVWDTGHSGTGTGAAGSVIPELKFTLAAGKDSAVIQYTIQSVDHYTYQSVPKTCQQTKFITVTIKPDSIPDNIIDVSCWINPPVLIR